MNLLALHLSKELSKATLEYSFGITLSKGIENSYYGHNETFHVMLAPFDVLTIIANTKREILDALKTLDISLDTEHKSPIPFQDYPILINPDLSSPFEVTNDAITLKNPTLLNFNLIALAISQSVGLESYEHRLDVLLSQSRRIVESINTFSIQRRHHLLTFAKRLALTRHDMLSHLLLMDKPNILWDNEEAEALYNRISLILELHDRLETALSKLSLIKEDVMLVMDLINHKKSEFLEWIIIILIVIEVIMGLIEFI